MNKVGRGFAKAILTVAVTVFVLRAVGFSAEELAAVDIRSWQLHPWPLVGSVVLLLVGYFCSGALWGRMVHELGGPQLPASDAVRIFMIANLGRYIPGKIWQIAGLAALAKSRGVPTAVAGASAIIGQLIALSAATVLGLTVFWANEDLRRTGEWGLLATVVLLIVISIPATLDALLRLIYRFSDQDAPVRRYGRSTFGVRWLAYYVANWIIYAVAFWLLYLGLQPFEPFVRVGPSFAAAYVVGYAMLISPAGVGVREGILVAALSPITSPAIGLSVAIIARAWTTAVELIPAGYFWVSEQRVNTETH